MMWHGGLICKDQTAFFVTLIFSLRYKSQYFESDNPPAIILNQINSFIKKRNATHNTVSGTFT
jgi:hypothetical protein